MNTNNVSKDEYKRLVVKPFSKFDTPEFIELNAHKVDEVKYFIFSNNKNRFGLAGGVKDSILKFPFSATFGCFSEISFNNSIEYYHSSIASLNNWAAKNSIKKIIFSLPALSYDLSGITKMQNALFCNKYKLETFDLNFEYMLNLHSEYYLQNLKAKPRSRYKIALNAGLRASKTEDSQKVYEIIKINRDQKGYPLWMSYDDVVNTSEIIPTDYFIVETENNVAIASAVVHNLTENVVRVVYWGNKLEYNNLNPTNFLAKFIFDYYKEKNKQIVDIGTSTLDSIPNNGLCDFKEHIGCTCSPKATYVMELV